MLSKPFAAVQSATSSSGVSGNGAVSRPSFIEAISESARGRRGRRGAATAVAVDVDPAAVSGALGDRVVDEHLVVAVGERRRRAGRRSGGPAATSA